MGCGSGRPAHHENPLLDSIVESFHKRYGKLIAQSLRDPSGTGDTARIQKAETKLMNPVLPSQISDHDNAATYGKRDSTAEYKEPHQTIFIFDWDDTLCPLTWARDSGNIGRGPPTARQKEGLSKLAENVVDMVSKAQTLGKVVLVTNGQRPWVERSCDMFLPSAKETLKDIPVIYAMELMTDVEKDAMPKSAVLTEAKARAMKAAVSDFYSSYPGQSWKNIVSIGDARYERDAVRQVVENRPPHMAALKKCRTKTIKLLERPTLFSLGLQLSVVARWLPNIVRADQDVEIDFGSL